MNFPPGPVIAQPLAWFPFFNLPSTLPPPSLICLPSSSAIVPFPPRRPRCLRSNASISSPLRARSSADPPISSIAYRPTSTRHRRPFPHEIFTQVRRNHRLLVNTISPCLSSSSSLSFCLMRAREPYTDGHCQPRGPFLSALRRPLSYLFFPRDAFASTKYTTFRYIICFLCILYQTPSIYRKNNYKSHFCVCIKKNNNLTNNVKSAEKRLTKINFKQ